MKPPLCCGEAAVAFRDCIGVFEAVMEEYARFAPATGAGEGLDVCACCAAALALRRASS